MLKKVLLFSLLAVGSSFAQVAGYFSGEAYVNISGTIRPVAGAVVTVCPTSSTGFPCTPKSTIYTDSTAGSPGSNPVTADTNGNFGFWAKPGNYLVTFTGSGVTSFQLTVTVAAPMASVPFIDPLFWGADPTGSADSYAAINSAMSEAITLGGAEVRFAPGVYLISAPLAPSGKLRLTCGGAMTLNTGNTGSCTIKKNATFSGNALTMGLGSTGSIVSGINFNGNKGAGATGDGIQIIDNSITLRDLGVVNMAGNGIRIGQSTAGGNANQFYLDNVRSANNSGACYYIQDQGSNANSGTINNSMAQSCGTDGLFAGSGSINVTLENFLSETNTGAGVHLGNAGSYVFNGGDLNEANNPNVLLDASVTGPAFFWGTNTGAGTNVVDNGTVPSIFFDPTHAFLGPQLRMGVGTTAPTSTLDVAVAQNGTTLISARNTTTGTHALAGSTYQTDNGATVVATSAFSTSYIDIPAYAGYGVMECSSTTTGCIIDSANASGNVTLRVGGRTAASNRLVLSTTNAAFSVPINNVTITQPATAATLTVANNKTFTVNNTLTLAGTDTTTMTFPTTSATIARTDAANTFTGHQTIEGVTSTGATGTGNLVFATSPAFTTPNIGAATTASQVTSTIATGTAPFSVASTTPVANLTTVPTTYNHSGTQQTGVHIVADTCTLGSTCVVTLTGSAVFTSSASYQCSATDETAAAAVRFAPSSGSAFTLTGTGTDVLSYHCVGN